MPAPCRCESFDRATQPAPVPRKANCPVSAGSAKAKGQANQVHPHPTKLRRPPLQKLIPQLRQNRSPVPAPVPLASFAASASGYRYSIIKYSG